MPHVKARFEPKFSESHRKSTKNLRFLAKMGSKCKNLFLRPPKGTSLCETTSFSLREGVLPSSQKTAIITPIVKKLCLDPYEPQNYRHWHPTWHWYLKWLSRSWPSRCVHISLSVIWCHLFSRPTAKVTQLKRCLWKVIAHIIDAADNEHVTLLGLLDVRAAFNTVDRSILLRRLEVSYGITGQVLQWLTSFLTDRTQVVTCAGA